MGVVVIIVLAAVAMALFAGWTRYFPWGPCPSCKGRRGKGRWSTDSAYRRCPRCGGSGERIRPLALIWPRHREEARRRKEARNRGR